MYKSTQQKLNRLLGPPKVGEHQRKNSGVRGAFGSVMCNSMKRHHNRCKLWPVQKSVHSRRQKFCMFGDSIRLCSDLASYLNAMSCAVCCTCFAVLSYFDLILYRVVISFLVFVNGGTVLSCLGTGVTGMFSNFRKYHCIPKPGTRRSMSLCLICCSCWLLCSLRLCGMCICHLWCGSFMICRRLCFRAVLLDYCLPFGKLRSIGII